MKIKYLLPKMKLSVIFEDFCEANKEQSNKRAVTCIMGACLIGAASQQRIVCDIMKRVTFKVSAIFFATSARL